MENFQVIRPSKLLTPYVRQYWFLSADVEKGSQRFMPGGCMGLGFNRGGNICSFSNGRTFPRSYISGQAIEYADLHFDSLDMIIVIFQPIGAKAVFGLPMNELMALHIPIDELGDPMLMELEERLLCADNNQTCVCWIERYLLNRIYLFEEYNMKRLSAVMSSIHLGETDLMGLAREACLGYKQFKRIFKDYVGLNPKDFIRINRFSKALNLLQTSTEINLNEISDKCGYYDKSHLIKEMKSLSGYIPSEVIRNSDPYSEYKSLFQSFFINT